MVASAAVRSAKDASVMCGCAGTAASRSIASAAVVHGELGDDPGVVTVERGDDVVHQTGSPSERGVERNHQRRHLDVVNDAGGVAPEQRAQRS
jgi:hypothetical protein